MTNPRYDFTDQVALITGAASGIGLAAARGYAESGAKVLLADIDERAVTRAADLLAVDGHQAIGVGCDVSDETQVADMVRVAVDGFGRLDMAFNNAGIAGYHGLPTDESADAFDELIRINLRGVWTCMKHELRHMGTQGSGAIVNTSSIGGLIGLPGRASYHAAKHGVIGLTKSAAMDYASLGIRINAICPGSIATPMLDNLAVQNPEALDGFLREQPIGRLGQPEEVAAAALWLCSEGASLVVGVALPVDGGFTAH